MASTPTPEFCAEAVRVALTSGLPRKQVAADFCVGFSTLSHWIQQDRCNPEKPTAQSDLEREIAELQGFKSASEPQLGVGPRARQAAPPSWKPHA